MVRIELLEPPKAALVVAVCCERGMWPCTKSQWMKQNLLKFPYGKVKTGQIIWNSQGFLSMVCNVAPCYGQGTEIMELSKITA